MPALQKKMAPADWQKIETIFQAALEIPESERVAWLAQRCGHDGELRREVESLLTAESESSDFLPKSDLPKAASFLLNESETSRIGQRLGPYKILEELGRGGMGVVYLAAREDEQFRQQVAIKLVKRGLDTEDILRRFRNERQILASLNHPNIANLHDGGTTEDGLPYFVMEHVEGLPLLQYCNEHELSVNARLEIFRRVCGAVQHAHQNLVIHRDLKPGNILVTQDGEVKLLDFGVAKLLNPELTGGDLAQTQAAFRVMTPEYASPEQVRGQHVTTATDIYSLGIILYELMAGARPYELKDASPEELSRLICDSEPSKPSEAVGTNPETERRGDTERENSIPNISTSQRRRVSLSQLRGDIDNIVLMALRKDPTRRYRSAEQFSADIERHLKGLPVIARKDTFVYRSSKFMQRHKIGVAAAALVTVAIVAGFIGITWQARVAARERDQARSERAKAERTQEFLAQMLGYSNPVLYQDSRATTITDVLDQAARRLDSGEFSDQPEVRAELEESIAKIYARQSRGDLAYKHLREAMAIQTKIYGENDPKTVSTKAYYAGLLFVREEMGESEKLFLRVLPLMRNEQKKGNIKAVDLAYALNTFAQLRRTQGDSKEAESLFREALALSPELKEEEWVLANGTTRSTLASTLADQGKFEDAMETSREAVAEYRQRQETNSPNFGFTLTVFGGFLADQGNYAEADASLREAGVIFRKSVSPSSLWLGDNLRNQGISFYRQGKYDEAAPKLRDSQKIYLDGFGKRYDHYPTVLITQGLLLSKTGNAQQGETLLREALKLRVELLPKDHFWVAIAKGGLGECLSIQKRYAEAEALLTESYASLSSRLGPGDPRTKEALQRLVSLYDLWNKPAQAERYRR